MNRTLTRIVTLATLTLPALPLVAGPTHADAAVKVMCNGIPATIVGTRGADRIVGTSSNDVIVGGAGSDRVFGIGGNDLICGGSGADHLTGGTGLDWVFGGSGRDVLREDSDSHHDLLNGGPDADVLRSTSVRGRRTERVLLGGAGDDRIVGSGNRDRFRGGAGDDHLVATTKFFSMAGNKGEDLLELSGVGGTVGLSGDGDSVQINSGRGSFSLTYVRVAGPVLVDLEAGYGQLEGSDAKDTFVGLTEQVGIRVKGTSGDDIMLGRDQAGASDTLLGAHGDDELSGRDGPDTLWGGPGSDVLDGGPGHDRGSGGSGHDTCTNVEGLLDC